MVDTTTGRRYFVDLDGYDEDALWFGTGPDDPDCELIARRHRIDGEHRDLWPVLVAHFVRPPRAATTAIPDAVIDVAAEAAFLEARVHEYADKRFRDIPEAHQQFWVQLVRRVLQLVLPVNKLGPEDIDWERVAVQLVRYSGVFHGLSTPERDALEEAVAAANERDWGTAHERTQDAANRGPA